MSEWELPTTVEHSSIERVGGGFAWESGVFDAKVKMVYLNQAKSEAISANIVLENSEGKELKESFWIKSGKSKGNKSYYTNQKDKKDYPLPGYAVANSLCIAATGDSLAKCIATAEKKTVKVWNTEAKKELPTERPVLMTLINKVIKVAVHQIKEDKTSKNDAGVYVPTGEERTVNECKFFGNAEGKTTEEILSGEPAEMFTKWAEKNTGKVIDKTTKVAPGVSAADIMGAATPAENSSASMFT